MKRPATSIIGYYSCSTACIQLCKLHDYIIQRAIIRRPATHKLDNKTITYKLLHQLQHVYINKRFNQIDNNLLIYIYIYNVTYEQLTNTIINNTYDEDGEEEEEEEAGNY